MCHRFFEVKETAYLLRNNRCSLFQFPLQISASNDPLVLAMNAEHRPSKTFDAIGFVRNRRLDATVPMVNTVSKKQFEPGSRVTQ